MMFDNERNGLIRHAIETGMKPMDLHRRAGFARTTIDRILFPEGMTLDGDDRDGVAGSWSPPHASSPQSNRRCLNNLA
ncbi:hypothetical protein [Streptomyces sp. NPDC055036]